MPDAPSAIGPVVEAAHSRQARTCASRGRRRASGRRERRTRRPRGSNRCGRSAGRARNAVPGRLSGGVPALVEREDGARAVVRSELREPRDDRGVAAGPSGRQRSSRRSGRTRRRSRAREAPGAPHVRPLRRPVLPRPVRRSPQGARGAPWPLPERRRIPPRARRSASTAERVLKAGAPGCPGAPAQCRASQRSPLTEDRNASLTPIPALLAFSAHPPCVGSSRRPAPSPQKGGTFVGTLFSSPYPPCGRSLPLGRGVVPPTWV